MDVNGSFGSSWGWWCEIARCNVIAFERWLNESGIFSDQDWKIDKLFVKVSYTNVELVDEFGCMLSMQSL